jgi:dopamine beta-monooxygenase
MQIHYTSQLRQYDAGIIEVGLEYTPKTALPPRMESVFVRGDCIQECTAVVMNFQRTNIK